MLNDPKANVTKRKVKYLSGISTPRIQQYLAYIYIYIEGKHTCTNTHANTRALYIYVCVCVCV